MEDIKRGDLLFDSLGRPAGVVEMVTDDEIVVRRRGQATIPAAAEGPDSNTGTVVGRFGKLVRVQF